MKLFDNNTTVCMCCDARLSNSLMHVKIDGIGICKRCFSKFHPNTPNMPFEGTESINYILSSFRYNDTIKKTIHRYKFYGNRKISELFFNLMKDYISKAPILKSFDIITAMPLHKKRLFNRGYNQAELIAINLSEFLDIPFSSCVYRSKNTLVQSTLKASERHKNTKNVFVADKEKVSGKRIILFDDVCTTRSTLDSCAKELKNRGAKEVIALTLANVYNL